MDLNITAEQKKQARVLKRCNLCGVAAKEHPGRHMHVYHPDINTKSFRWLQWGELPVGDEKFCSNWQDIWNDDFEPSDTIKMSKGTF